MANKALSNIELTSFLKIFGRRALKNKSVHNALYDLVLVYSKINTGKCWELLEILCKFGTNYKAADFFAAYGLASY